MSTESLKVSAILLPAANRISEMRYLLDTNVLSQPVKLTPNERVLRRWREHAADLTTAAPVWNELLFGLYRLPVSKRRDRFEHYLEEVLRPSLSILPYDAKAAEWHAAERARLGRAGKSPSFVDGQIAAIAKTRDLVLVTQNVRHFTEFEGLTIEDWSVPAGRAPREAE